MTLYSHDPACEIHQGHVLDVLAEMPAESVDCCITSPPYWGLRSYSGDQLVTWPDGSKTALGLEPTPELYLSHLVEIFRAVRRVLKPWGTCWINCGDSYAGSGKSSYNEERLGGDMQKGNKGSLVTTKTPVPNGLKPLDLCGIPESLVLALRADGWYWRSTIIWAKPNPMPESVSGWRWERHKVKVGKVKLETYTSQKNRVGEGKGTGWSPAHPELGQAPTLADWQDCPGCSVCLPNDGLILRKGSWRPTSSFEYVFMLAKSKDYFGDGEALKVTANRNERDVWTINTQPFPGAHFATFPEDLVTKPILASTSDKGNCPNCGMPWVRVVEKVRGPVTEQMRAAGADARGEYHGIAHGDPEEHLAQNPSDTKRRILESMQMNISTLSWRASCSCGLAETVPAVVLDPFCGSGTTLAVAKRLGRHAIGIDLSTSYLEMSRCRVEAETERML